MNDRTLSTTSGNNCFYTVKCDEVAGDFSQTLTTIAEHASEAAGYAITTDDIFNANPQITAEGIFPCQELIVPCEETTEQPPAYTPKTHAGFKGGEIYNFVDQAKLKVWQQIALENGLGAPETITREIGEGECQCRT